MEYKRGESASVCVCLMRGLEVSVLLVNQPVNETNSFLSHLAKPKLPYKSEMDLKMISPLSNKQILQTDGRSEPLYS